MHFIPQLLTNRFVRHHISTKDEGNMSYVYGEREEVLTNRKKFFTDIRIPTERSIIIEVQHGTKIIEASSSLGGTGFNSAASAIKADAIITREKNLAVGLLTADCIPAILFDRLNGILCLAHLSRKNTEERFSQILISFFRREFDTNLHELKIFMGPSIKKDSYILEEYPNGYDLTGENIKQLLLKGVREENIIVDPTDTATDTNFFSHYRESRKKENEGRFLTTTMLV